MRITGLSHAGLGNFKAAIDMMERAVLPSGRHPWVVANLGEIHLAAGNIDEGRRLLEECLASAASRYVQPSIQAMCNASLGRLDEAFAWCERAREAKDLLPVLNYFASGSPITLDPRWRVLMRQLGLEPAERVNWILRQGLTNSGNQEGV